MGRNALLNVLSGNGRISKHASALRVLLAVSIVRVIPFVERVKRITRNPLKIVISARFVHAMHLVRRVRVLRLFVRRA